MAGSSVVIIGTGHAGFQTAASLRETGFDGEVLLVGDEPRLPYQRPPLSKGFLTGKTSIESLWFRPRTFYEKHEIDLLLGERAVLVDRARRQVTLASGASVRYHHLVLATGSSPRTLNIPGTHLDGVLTLRTLTDSEALAERLGTARHAVVIGGGFIGLEFAAVAGSVGVEVAIVEMLPRLMARAVSPDMSAFYAEEHVKWGARVLLGRHVARLIGEARGRLTGVETSDGERLPADVALVAVGIRPNVELAEACGLLVDDGVVVNEHLLTNDPRISAAGDCANYPTPSRPRVRLESVQNAADHGGCVAARLAGHGAPYRAVPWFWTDQRDLRMQMAGLTAGHDQTVVRGDPKARSFSVFCFERGRLLGAESVNRPADHMAVRLLTGAARDGDCELTPEQAADEAFDLKSYARSSVGAGRRHGAAGSEARGPA
ncbi:MAG: NAD(P)/FAD-dependent oxidoreductase [Actinomycetota bacterium]